MELKALHRNVIAPLAEKKELMRSQTVFFQQADSTPVFDHSFGT